MHRTRPLFFLLLASALATGARAQGQFFEPGATLTWPSGSALAPMKHPVAGHFVDTAQTDVCFLANGVPTLCISPESLGSYSSIPTTANEVVNDIVTVAGAGVGGRDGLATVGSDGLRMRTFSPGTSAFTWTALSTHANWLGAKKIRVGDLDGSGSSDYAGVGSTGLFVVCRFNGTSPAPRFTVPNAIRDLQLVQWDADSARELAVLTTWGLYVYESNGTLDASFAKPGGSAGAIAVVHSAGSGTDEVAWLSPASGAGNPSLYEVVPGAGSPSLLISDLGSNYSVITGADMPGYQSLVPDGSTDLMLLAGGNCAPLFLRQSSSGTRFSLATSTLVDPRPVTCEPFGRLTEQVDEVGPQELLFDDLTSDQLPDLFLGIGLGQASPPYGGRRCEFLHCRNYTTGVQDASGSVVIQDVALGTTDQAGKRKLYLKINTDPSALPAGTMTSSTNCVEINIWRELGPSSAPQLTSNSIVREVVEFTPGPQTSCIYTVDLTEDTCFGNDYQLYWIQVRYAHVDTQSSPAQLSPAGGACVSYLGTDLALLDSCYIMGQSIALQVWIQTGGLCSSSTPGDAKNCEGSTVFSRGPGHATRPSIRRDTNGTVPYPKSVWSLIGAYTDPFPSAATGWL